MVFPTTKKCGIKPHIYQSAKETKAQKENK